MDSRLHDGGLGLAIEITTQHIIGPAAGCTRREGEFPELRVVVCMIRGG